MKMKNKKQWRNSIYVTIFTLSKRRKFLSIKINGEDKKISTLVILNFIPFEFSYFHFFFFDYPSQKYIIERENAFATGKISAAQIQKTVKISYCLSWYKIASWVYGMMLLLFSKYIKYVFSIRLHPI